MVFEVLKKILSGGGGSSGENVEPLKPSDAHTSQTARPDQTAKLQPVKTDGAGRFDPNLVGLRPPDSLLDLCFLEHLRTQNTSASAAGLLSPLREDAATSPSSAPPPLSGAGGEGLLEQR